MTSSADFTAQKLLVFIERWVRENRSWARGSFGQHGQLRTARQVAQDMLEEVEFRDVGLASWINGPDGALITSVVGLVLPWPESAEYQLLIEAILIAGQTQQANQRGLAAGVMLMLGVLIALVRSLGARHVRSA